MVGHPLDRAVRGRRHRRRTRWCDSARVHREGCAARPCHACAAHVCAGSPSIRRRSDRVRPPGRKSSSASTTRAPARPATSAAISPAGPPPATSTSQWTCRFLVVVRIARAGGAAQAGGAADQRLVHALPEAARPHEGLVVEPRSQERGQPLVHAQQVERQRWVSVLARAPPARRTVRRRWRGCWAPAARRLRNSTSALASSTPADTRCRAGGGI